MGRLIGPGGAEITRTLELIPGTCGLLGVELGADGNLVLEYDGNGTDVDWDGQVQVKREGALVFLDDDGNQFLERDLTLVESEA